jgi:hypothetical protein
MERHNERVHAAREGGFVVFLVGMRINRLRAVREWLPVVVAAPRMVREQERERDPEGLLGSRLVREGLRGLTLVQYWSSFEALTAYARREGTEHRTWWQRYNTQAAESDAVGIWHETYLVRPGEYETVYRHVPPLGLGAADGSDLVPARESRETAHGRLGREGDPAPFTPAGEVTR